MHYSSAVYKPLLLQPSHCYVFLTQFFGMFELHVHLQEDCLNSARYLNLVC